MSLYGALYAGVAGLQAQSNKLGVISDNIANVNTVGYKEGSATFETLVTNANNSTAYSPGGVLGGNQQLVSTQGLLQTTSSPTDIAISGSGLFVVNQSADGTGQVLYTRAASFTQDSNGNFVNTAGFFLQAWPLDHNGLLPGAPGNVTDTTSSANLSSLKTVNVQDVTGTAASTTNVSISANLNAGQVAALGAGISAATPDPLDSNAGVSANELLLPSQPPGAALAADQLTQGDQFTISNGSGTLNTTFTYGGFSTGRNVTAGAGVAGGDAGTTLQSNTPIALNGVASATSLGDGIGGSGALVQINLNGVTAASLGLVNGDVVSLAGIGDLAGGTITSADMTGNFVISNVDSPADSFQITATGGTDNPGDTITGGTVVVRPFVGAILDANNDTTAFLGTTGTSGFTPSGLTFTITTPATGTVTFSYVAAAPNAQLGQFNTLTNLATAINDVTGLTARIEDNGQLVVGAADANAAVMFNNGSTQGIAGPPVKAGIDWVNELGLVDVPSSASLAPATVPDRFNSLQSLAGDINALPGNLLVATINNPTGDSSISINSTDPLGTISFADGQVPPLPNNNVGSVLAALGMSTSEVGQTFLPETVGPLGPSYDPSLPAKNMSSGAIPAQFSRPVTVYDAQGGAHNLNVAFLKTGINTWSVEVYSQPGSDISGPTDGSTPSDGQLASGTITFSGNGTLLDVTGAIANTIPINWTNGASSSSISFNWGTIGKTDGLTQSDSDYNVNSVNQNGTPVGQLTGVSIDSSGDIIASFNNGETQKLYQIPLAEFSDPDQLQSLSGNAYAQTAASGDVNLKQSGTSGVGTISSGALEQSNVELANQLTDMIVAQRAYQANTKVIQTADTLLDDLDQIIQ